MNVIDHVVAQHEMADVWGDIGDLTAKYSRSGSFEERETIARRIGALHDRAADLIEKSGLVRWLAAGLDSPDVLRRRAEHWRLHGDPETGNR